MRVPALRGLLTPIETQYSAPNGLWGNLWELLKAISVATFQVSILVVVAISAASCWLIKKIIWPPSSPSQKGGT